MMRFGEQSGFGQPGSRSCGERRAFTAHHEITEFSLGLHTRHRPEGLQVEVMLLGDQPGHGFLALPVYQEVHERPNDSASPEPDFILNLEAQVMESFASRLASALRSSAA
jgi:hypothetical protein